MRDQERKQTDEEIVSTKHTKGTQKTAFFTMKIMKLMKGDVIKTEIFIFFKPFMVKKGVSLCLCG